MTPGTTKAPDQGPGPQSRFFGLLMTRCLLLLGVGGRGRGGREPVALVLELKGHLAQLVLVGVAVVSTEQQLTAGGEGHADVGLGSATVASVISGQLRVRGKC